MESFQKGELNIEHVVLKEKHRNHHTEENNATRT